MQPGIAGDFDRRGACRADTATGSHPWLSATPGRNCGVHNTITRIDSPEKTVSFRLSGDSSTSPDQESISFASRQTACAGPRYRLRLGLGPGLELFLCRQHPRERCAECSIVNVDRAVLYVRAVWTPLVDEGQFSPGPCDHRGEGELIVFDAYRSQRAARHANCRCPCIALRLSKC